MTSSDPNADATNHQYDIHMQTGKGNAIGPNAQVTNYHYGPSQPQRELEAYFEKMDQMLPSLLKKNFLGRRNEAVIGAAEILTLRTLDSLDKAQKRQILLYLYRSKLIDRVEHIISLARANLSGANLTGASLYSANLQGANLTGANLQGARLTSANLNSANLSGANLTSANLSWADLTWAHLSYAKLNGADLSRAILQGARLNKAWVTKEQLSKAESLKGATMPDGSKHP